MRLFLHAPMHDCIFPPVVRLRSKMYTMLACIATCLFFFLILWCPFLLLYCIHLRRREQKMFKIHLGKNPLPIVRHHHHCRRSNKKNARCDDVNLGSCEWTELLKNSTGNEREFWGCICIIIGSRSTATSHQIHTLLLLMLLMFNPRCWSCF